MPLASALLAEVNHDLHASASLLSFDPPSWDPPSLSPGWHKDAATRGALDCRTQRFFSIDCDVSWASGANNVLIEITAALWHVLQQPQQPSALLLTGKCLPALSDYDWRAGTSGWACVSTSDELSKEELKSASHIDSWSMYLSISKVPSVFVNSVMKQILLRNSWK